ncbi:MAG: insulinase family protein [Candidatus Spechtbacteria bacterium]|nr:insulinase family protein [Candidatus Spechtbacteria bacterium]
MNQSEIILENGMRLTVINSHELPLVRLYGIIKAGNYFHYNPYIPVLTSDLLTRGTAQQSRKAFAAYCDKFGLEFDMADCGPLNVFFNGSSPSRFIDFLLAVCRDALFSPLFSAEELAIAKKENLAGVMRGADSPELLAKWEVMSMLYTKNHPLYAFPAEQYLERYIDFVNNATRNEIVAFWKTWYAPSRIHLVLAGDVDAPSIQTAQALFEREVGAFSFFANQTYLHDVLPLQADERIVYLPQKSSAVYWAGQAISITSAHADFPALKMAIAILGAGMQSRLFNQVREKKGYSYSIGATINYSEEFPGYWRIIAHCNPSNIWKVRDEVADVLRIFVEKGVTEEEIREAQMFLKGRRFFAASSLQGIAAQTIPDIIAKHPGLTQSIEDRIMVLTVDEVNDVMRRHVIPDAMKVALAGTIDK